MPMRVPKPNWSRRWWIGAFLVAITFAIAMTYLGWGRTDPHWSAPLQYPNRGAKQIYERDAFSSAAVCGGCHRQHYAEWVESGMGRSSQLSHFLIELYEAGLDLRDAPVEDIEQCLHCHAPIALMGPTPDLDLALEISREGVNCDVCHTAVAAHPNDAPGMLQWDPDGPKRGPLPGRGEGTDGGVPEAVSPHHGTRRSTLHESSDLCGACHMSLWPSNALPIDWTYAEWKRSPYAERGVTCQECHMPTYRGSAAPEAPVRDNLHRHTFPGGGDREFVKTAAEIELEVHRHFAGHEIEIRVENTGAGHAFPTGNATAPVVSLELSAYDEDGNEVFADKRDYRLVYVDADGDVTSDPTTAVKVRSDTTLQPLEPHRERFYLPHDSDAVRAEAELVYRRWSEEIVDNHAGLLREFVGRYLEQGLQVHRVLARLGDLDYDKLDRVRSFEPIVVDRAEAPLPGPPKSPTPAAER